MSKNPRLVKRIRIVGIAVGVISTVVIAPLDLVPPLLAPLPHTVDQQLDAALDLGLDGIIVCVDRAGQPPVSYAAGLKNKATGEAVGPRALFKIGSIHKLYIATAVAKLVSSGRLSLDGTLAGYLPETAGRIEYAEAITLRMMVQHRSGIPNFTDDSAFDWFKPQTEKSRHLELIYGDPADFKPDTRYRYSNTNYLLIGRILDRVLGYSHHQYVYSEILAPLGIHNTFFSLDEVEPERVVSGYWYHYDDDLKSLGGSMLATAEDVALFLRALNDGSLLSDDEQAIYTSIYKFQHTGWVPGYHSIARYHPDMDAVVIQFVNTTGGKTWGIADVVGGKATAFSHIVYNRIVKILRRQ